MRVKSVNKNVRGQQERGRITPIAPFFLSRQLLDGLAESAMCAPFQDFHFSNSPEVMRILCGISLGFIEAAR
jgi:hypothetical protein